MSWKTVTSVKILNKLFYLRTAVQLRKDLHDYPNVILCVLIPCLFQTFCAIIAKLIGLRHTNLKQIVVGLQVTTCLHRYASSSLMCHSPVFEKRWTSGTVCTLSRYTNHVEQISLVRSNRLMRGLCSEYLKKVFSDFCLLLLLSSLYTIHIETIY